MVEFLYIPGDLLIGGVADAHYSGSEPLSCGDVKTEGMMAVVAFYYAIQTAKSKMPGILNGVNLPPISRSPGMYRNSTISRGITQWPHPEVGQGDVGRLDNMMFLLLSYILISFLYRVRIPFSYRPTYKKIKTTTCI
jgi:hypothetical protein